MEIISEKNRKKQYRYVLAIAVLIIALPFIINKFTMSQIEDTNGNDTAITSFKIDNYKESTKFVGYESSISYSGGTSKKNADIETKADYDRISFTSKQFSGMKVLQVTEVTGPVTFSVSSQIESGNFEVAVFRDKTCVKVIKANETISIPVTEAGIYTIVIGAESAKGTVTAERK